jgi:hypothetical protein
MSDFRDSDRGGEAPSFRQSSANFLIFEITNIRKVHIQWFSSTASNSLLACPRSNRKVTNKVPAHSFHRPPKHFTHSNLETQLESRG